MSDGSQPNTDFLIQQFVKLREEIYVRTGIQQQLVALALIGAGATLTIGANNSVTFGIPVLLLYPVLVMFLAIAWSTQYATIRDMGAFIAHLEQEVFLKSDASSLGWETLLLHGPFRRERSSPFISGWQDAKGIFAGIQVLAIGLAIARSGISLAAIRLFLEHPHIIRPYLWTILLGLADLVVLGVTLSLPRSHPSMRRSLLKEVPEGAHPSTVALEVRKVQSHARDIRPTNRP